MTGFLVLLVGLFLASTEALRAATRPRILGRAQSRRAATRPPLLGRAQSRLQAQSEEEGYSAFGSLTRQGPVPFFIRLAKPDTYNAAVSKYQALEKVSRLEAMANMDAYFQDPNGWAGQKLREKKGAPKLDYIEVNQDPGALALTAVWAVGITGLFWRIFQVQVLDK